jgi:hypothetical protein
MISVLVCSISIVDLENLKKSIVRNIDENSLYEVLAYDNTIDRYGITKVYNVLASRAKYPNLIFIHEDVEFMNKGWDKSLLTLLQNKKNGIIGIAGSTYLPSVPSGWYLHDDKYNNVFVYQGFKYIESPVRFDNKGEDLTPVYLLDGVFLAMRKEVWEEFPFNEKLTGFHAYDVDISQRVSSKYQNVFTKQIELLHKSEGKVDQTYFDAILKYKLSYSNFVYPKRNHKLEYELLNQFYSHLRCYYDKKDCIEKVTPFIKIKFLGWKGYLSFKKMLRDAK